MSLMNMLIPVAMAQSTTPEHSGAGLMSMLPMLVIFLLVFYFLLIRPQSKRAKEQRNLIDNLAKGDEVITAGGLLGKIIKIEDGFLVLAIAKGVEVTVQKGSVSSTVPKGTLKSV